MNGIYLCERREIKVEIFVNTDFYRFGKGMDIGAFPLYKIIDRDYFFRRIGDPVFPDAGILIQHEFTTVIHVFITRRGRRMTK